MSRSEHRATALRSTMRTVRAAINGPDGPGSTAPARLTAGVGESDWVRLWRPTGAPGVVAMHARGTSFRSAPCEEYVVAHLAHGRMDVVRGHERYRLEPGELALWRPGWPRGAWFGTGGAWEARLLVIELPRVADLAGDLDACVHGIEFPGPVLRDRARATSFLALLATLARPRSALDHEAALAAWLRQLAEPLPLGSRGDDQRRSARRDPALRVACELIHHELAANLDLARVAAAAAVSRFQLIRLFKAGLGLPPHRYQIQLRVQRARTLLEAGHAPAEVAQLVGFFDQSHLSRHFTRRMGLTPARYAHAFQGPRSATRLALGPVAEVGRPLVAGQVPAEHVA